MSGEPELPKNYQRVRAIERGRCRPDQVAHHAHVGPFSISSPTVAACSAVTTEGTSEAAGVDVSPGLKGGVAAGSGYQTVQRVWLSVAGEDASFDLHSVPLSELDPVRASEILRDLAEVTGR